MEAIDPTKFAEAKSIEEVHSLLAATGMGPGWNKPEPSLWAGAGLSQRSLTSASTRAPNSFAVGCPPSGVMASSGRGLRIPASPLEEAP